MAVNKNVPATIDEYIAGFPKNVQEILEQVRATIKKAAPGAEEKINSGIPTFILNGNLVQYPVELVHIASPQENSASIPVQPGLHAMVDGEHF